MTFDEVIKGLYSENRKVVLAILNAGCHLDSICDSDIFVVDTGFECKLHTGTIFRVVYCVSEEKLIYFKKEKHIKSYLGLPFRINREKVPGFEYRFFYSSERKTLQYFDRYDAKTKSFHPISVKEHEKDVLTNMITFVLEDGSHKNNFIIKDAKENETFYCFNYCDLPSIYDPYDDYSPIFYKDYNGFHEYKPQLANMRLNNKRRKIIDNDDYYDNSEDNYWNNNRCEKYNGYNGWTDDQIDDIFGGCPEATWNVD